MTATTTQTVGQFFESHKCVNIYSATSNMEPVAVSCKCGRWIDADRDAEGCTVEATAEGNSFVCRKCSE